MPITRAALTSFYEDLTPYVVATIGEFKEQPTKFSEFLNIKSTDTGWVDINTLTGHGLWQEKGELVDAKSDEPIQGPTARAKVLTYAQRTAISDEAIEDGKGGFKAADGLKRILRAGRATQEVLAHDVLNSAFGSVVTPDGQPLIDSAHVLLGGGTASNLATGDFSQSNLEDAITAIQNAVDDRGIPIMQTASTLVVSPLFQWVAKVVLGTPNVVGSEHNDINPMSMENIKLVVSPYLTDDDAWYLLAAEHELNWYWRRQVSNWSEVDYVKGAVEVGASFRAVTAAHDWRGIVGSAGS